jgi:hypothetical protein
MGEKFIDWLIDTSLEFAGGQIFGKATSRLSDEVKEGLEGWWETAYGVATEKIKEETEKAKKGGPKAPSADDISAILRNVLTFQKEGLANYTSWLFSGSDEAVTEFRAQVINGKWMDVKNGTIAQSDFEDSIFKWIWGSLIVEVWKQNPLFAPVIIMGNKADDTSNPFADNRDAGYVNEWINDDGAAESRHSLDGKTFWFVTSQVCNNWRFDSEVGDYCLDAYFTTLPGINEVDGTNDDWSKTNYKDMIASAYGGFKLNGNKNGCKCKHT